MFLQGNDVCTVMIQLVDIGLRVRETMAVPGYNGNSGTQIRSIRISVNTIF